MATSSSQADAKNEFTSAVRIGIEALMNRCGYSRERAITALLKELNRNNDNIKKNNSISNSPNNKPTDDEVCFVSPYRYLFLLYVMSYVFDAFLESFHLCVGNHLPPFHANVPGTLTFSSLYPFSRSHLSYVVFCLCFYFHFHS